MPTKSFVICVRYLNARVAQAPKGVTGASSPFTHSTSADTPSSYPSGRLVCERCAKDDASRHVRYAAYGDDLDEPPNFIPYISGIQQLPTKVDSIEAACIALDK